MKARSLIEAEVGPRAFLKQLGKYAPVKPEDEQELAAAGFEAPEINDIYLDFKRYPKGFGKAGDDRYETVSMNRETGKWFAHVSHVDHAGNWWYEVGSAGYYGGAGGAIDWLELDQERAPRMPVPRQRVESEAKRWIMRTSRPYNDPETRQQFIDYLTHTLIPDLQDSGMDATAEEFETGVRILQQEPSQAAFEDSDLRGWVRWMQNTWIPDLRRSGTDATADDVETMIRFIAGRGYWVQPEDYSHDMYPNRIRMDYEESKAKSFIMGMPRQLRPGPGWTLFLRAKGISDDIPVEMLQGNEFDMLDAPYSLGFAVEEALVGTGRSATFYDEVGVYTNAIQQQVKAGVQSGEVTGIAGACLWSLEDRETEVEF